MVYSTHNERASREKHRLRILINREKPILGMSLPKHKVAPLLGTWFTTRIEGTTIILESGCAPVQNNTGSRL